MIGIGMIIVSPYLSRGPHQVRDNHTPVFGGWMKTGEKYPKTGDFGITWTIDRISGRVFPEGIEGHTKEATCKMESVWILYACLKTQGTLPTVFQPSHLSLAYHAVADLRRLARRHPGSKTRAISNYSNSRNGAVDIIDIPHDDQGHSHFQDKG